MSAADIRVVGGGAGDDVAKLVDGRKAVRASGGTRDCIILRPPSQGVLELFVANKPWLAFVTRLRVAQTGDARADGVDEPRVEAWVDGAEEGHRNVRTTSHVRIPFAPPRESLLVKVGGDGAAKRDLCLSLSDRAWRNHAH